jgi:hypothetical protein
MPTLNKNKARNIQRKKPVGKINQAHKWIFPIKYDSAQLIYEKKI